ncbi:hypothetical protein THRCLA_21039 [Thraustotheca clavata]|uniref:DUF2423 domain-containing protein n=1 Tax=Thraustotheca clavata TaxID=74557 RepID=A0A1W0A0Z2_9STRA|nr:hypothetical protein THRCLA_21039 [Thraustotheca clavata]
MAKSIRSKVKKYFRRELRNTIGQADYDKKQAIVQEALKKQLEQQQGSSLASLRTALGGGGPIAVAPEVDETMMDTEGAVEAEMDNVVVAKQSNRKDALLKKKKLAGKAGSKKKKFVHFHTLRKKGA